MTQIHFPSLRGGERHAFLARDVKLSLNRLFLLAASVAKYAAERQSDYLRLVNVAEATRRELEKLEALSSEIVLGQGTEQQGEQFEIVRLDRIIQQAVAQLWLDAELMDIELDYGSPLAPLEVTGDPALLSHAVQNVILNSIESTSRAGFVAIEAEYANGCPCVIVTDTAIANSKAALRKLSDAGAAEDSRNRSWNRDDSVAGLLFVRQVMKLHGGRFVLGNSGDRQSRRFILKFPGKQPAQVPQKESCGRAR